MAKKMRKKFKGPLSHKEVAKSERLLGTDLYSAAFNKWTLNQKYLEKMKEVNDGK